MKKRRAKRAGPKQVKAWSYSVLSNYENCPAKVKYEKLDGLRQPPSPAMSRGSRIHEHVEQYLLRNRDDLPEECLDFEEEFADLRRCKGLVPEGKFAFTEDWALCEWFAPNAWARGTLDWRYPLSETKLVVGDLKTGKIRSSHAGQCELYAMFALIAFPHVRRVEVELWYCDQGEIHSEEYKRSDLEGIREKWRPRWEALLSETVWPATPNPLCGWCAYRQSEGGPCQHG